MMNANFETALANFVRLAQQEANTYYKTYWPNQVRLPFTLSTQPYGQLIRIVRTDPGSPAAPSAWGSVGAVSVWGFVDILTGIIVAPDHAGLPTAAGRGSIYDFNPLGGMGIAGPAYVPIRTDLEALRIRA